MTSRSCGPRLRPPTTGSGNRGSGHHTAAAIPAHRLPALLAARAPRSLPPAPHPDVIDTRTPPPPPPPLIGRRGGCFFGVGFPRRGAVPQRARLTLRSPPTRTRRALFGRHAAVDDRPPENHIEPRRLRPALPVRLDTSFCTNDTANVPNCTATPHCVSSLPFKNPFLQKFARRALAAEKNNAPLAARAAAPCATSSWWLRAACAWSRTPRRVCMAGRRS